VPTILATPPAAAAPTAESSPAERTTPEHSLRRARRGLAIYLTCVIVGSAAVELAMSRNGSSIAAQGVPVAVLMWIPGLASVIARLALREGFRDVSFRLGGRAGLKFVAVGWGFPVAVGAAAYGVAGVAGFAEMTPPQLDHFPQVTSVAIKFVLSLVLGLTLLTLVGTLTAAGEEIGWRGYMLTLLVDARLPHRTT
jgi:CAAX protease family protein